MVKKYLIKKAEDNQYPDLARVRKMKEVIAAKLEAIPAAAD